MAPSAGAGSPAALARGAAAPAASDGPVSLSAALRALGLVGERARAAALALLGDADAGAALIDGLAVTDDAALRRLVTVCDDPTCRTVAEIDGRVVVEGPCAICQGSDSRRWWHRMERALGVAGRARLVVVGGGASSHARLGLLARETPGVTLVVVEGTSNQTRQRARQRVKVGDVVVLWGSTILDHRVSDVYRAAADATDGVVQVSVGEGGRGIVGLARAVVGALEATRR